MVLTSLLPYTDDARANALLEDNSFALLVGFVLYQQVQLETAFLGPQRISDRLDGDLDATRIAEMDPDDLEQIFREKPAVHRFPGNMAKRVQAVAQFVAAEYDGDPAGIWSGVDSADDLIARLTAIPGFGDYKATIMFSVLARRLDVHPDGWESRVADWPTLADIASPEDRAALKVRKKEWKASQA